MIIANDFFMRQTVLLLTVLSISFFVSCSSLDNSSIAKYNKEINNINGWVWDIGSIFYKGNLQYYKSIEELHDLNKQDSSFSGWLNRIMIDPYAKNGEIIRYIPIYDDCSTHVIACIFLSVGEDGVFNNNITEKLHVNNWNKMLQVYNTDEVKQEIEKIEIRYPLFNRKTGRQGWHSLNIDEATLQSENILLKGDSIFMETFNRKSMDKLVNPKRPFVYRKFSITRKLFGKKDYIVNWGCRVVEYEVSSSH